MTFLDPWFIDQILQIVELENNSVEEYNRRRPDASGKTLWFLGRFDEVSGE